MISQCSHEIDSVIHVYRMRKATYRELGSQNLLVIVLGYKSRQSGPRGLDRNHCAILSLSDARCLE